MNKLRMITMCLFAMMVSSLSVKAQEVTITLFPGWNWISYPNAVSMEISEALGTFNPMNGDKIKGQFSNSSYNNGYWRGGVTHFVPGMGYMYYSSRSEVTSFVFAEASNSVVVTNTPTDVTAEYAVVGGTVTISESNHVFARGVCWGSEPNPNIDGSHTTDATITGSLSDTLTGLTPNTTYYVRAYMVTDYGLAYGEELSFTTQNDGGGHDYVDLGLPSGTLWATCNVGADAPEEYGDYFAWGETQPKDIYNCNTYQYCNGSDEDQLIKYCNDSIYGYNGFTDNLTTLLPEDDAATVNWGNGWRMPTQAEFQELLDNTTVIWSTQNGVYGRLFTASNGNSLFLPAAGCRMEDYLDFAGNSGSYCSSSLDTDYPNCARSLAFSFRYIDMLRSYRIYGRPVRAVRSAQ